LKQLLALARQGATILFQSKLPQDVPGWGRLEERRAALHKALGQLKFGTGEIRRAAIGRGSVLLGASLGALLQSAGVNREPCVDVGLHFLRRAHAEGFHYFIVNRSEQPVDNWVTLGTRAASALLMDPRFEDRIGRAALKDAGGATRVRLQLQPGESVILRTFTNKVVEASPWSYFENAGPPQAVSGRWKVQFIEGGPELPAGYESAALVSWTVWDDVKLKGFAGTARYTIEFEKPTGDADEWLLDLGRVCESARVTLNGQAVGALWCRPFAVAVGRFLKPGTNVLEIEVTNLAANRIRDLDQRQVNWKYFYDINIVGRDYRPLDASTWPLRDSGLLGPVVLKPMKRLVEN
jgi:hypothetical protein